MRQLGLGKSEWIEEEEKPKVEKKPERKEKSEKKGK